MGNPRAVAVCKRLIEQGVGGRACWVSGISGCGKTSLCRILAASIADDWMTTEYDSGADLTGSELSRLLDSLALCGAGKGGRAVVVNESHSLRADVIDRLKGVLERIPGHVVWTFSTTREDQDKLFEDHVGAAQLLSRCIRIPLSNQGLAQAFAEMWRKGAIEAGLDGQPIEAYLKLARKVNNNGRAGWQEIESGAMLA